MIAKIIDSLLFIALLFLGQYFALYGKYIAQFLFTSHRSIDLLLPQDAIAPSFMLAISIIYQLIRIATGGFSTRIVISAVVGMCISLAVQYYSEERSPIDFFLLLYLYGVITLVIVFDQYKNIDMSPDFWRFSLDFAIKIIRYMLIVYVVGVVFLEYLPAKTGDDDLVEIAFFHQTTVLVFSLFYVGYWIIVPYFKNVVEVYKTDRERIEENLTKRSKRRS
ncbi:MAG: hypothetical protein ABW077_16450 [Candidatus Thiodiazotropha endolucinida]